MRRNRQFYRGKLIEKQGSSEYAYGVMKIVRDGKTYINTLIDLVEVEPDSVELLDKKKRKWERK